MSVLECVCVIYVTPGDVYQRSQWSWQLRIPPWGPAHPHPDTAINNFVCVVISEHTRWNRTGIVNICCTTEHCKSPVTYDTECHIVAGVQSISHGRHAWTFVNTRRTSHISTSTLSGLPNHKLLTQRNLIRYLIYNLRSYIASNFGNFI
jgi:hypothetical protein